MIFIRNILFFLTLSICGCSDIDNSHDYPIVRFALLSECEKSAIGFLSSLKSKSQDISYRVEKFDKVLDSHPTVIGYIEISSSIDSYEGLKSIVNRITSDCYPETSTSISVDEDISKELTNSLNINEHLGIERTYIVLENDVIRLFYHEK